ncbi:hypothetical protein NKJ93_32220 [Mesorhizobium sp. M0028]|uniref:hypothetical protein n=1 Tax=Mesorhizobium sp. M0028 TaxID=2956849 RepID=UPI0033380FAF
MRAIARRAFDLGLVDAAQYRTDTIQLVKTGQAKVERYDERVAVEEPELLRAALSWLSSRDRIVLHRLLSNLGMIPALFARLTGERMPTLSHNVVPLGTAKPL